MILGQAISEIKNGERSSYLAWKHLRLSFDDILDLYVNQLSEMSEHSFLHLGTMYSTNNVKMFFKLERC